MQYYQYHDIIFILLIVVILQSLAILNWSKTKHICVSDVNSKSEVMHVEQRSINLTNNLDLVKFSAHYKTTPVVVGVAVTTFLGSPKWYQNRYTLMINQMLSVLPEDWAIQVFYNPKSKMAVEGTSYLGIQNQLSRGRLFLTPLPETFNKIKKNELMMSPYLWEHVRAENVLLFGGNSVLCANSNQNISYYANNFDYIGTPWQEFQGAGGGNGLSLRKRSIVLDILYTLHNSTNTAVNNKDSKKNKLKLVKEDTYIVGEMIKKNEYRMATREDTYAFAMSGKIAIGTPLGAVGTLDGLTDKLRQQYIDYCPEIKMMFPSLHSPPCFGAEPDAVGCFKYLCIDGGLKCHMQNNSASYTHAKSMKHVTIDVSSVSEL